MVQIIPGEARFLPDIRALITAAFPKGEHAAITALVTALSDETTTPPITPWVASQEGQVIGYACYSPVFFAAQTQISAAILAPLAVAPEHQKQGIGTALIEAGTQSLRVAGVDVLLVYGDPNYYGRFGFDAQTALPFQPPYPLQYPLGWQGMMLTDTSPPISPLAFTCVTGLSDPHMW